MSVDVQLWSREFLQPLYVGGALSVAAYCDRTSLERISRVELPVELIAARQKRASWLLPVAMAPFSVSETAFCAIANNLLFALHPALRDDPLRTEQIIAETGALFPADTVDSISELVARDIVVSLLLAAEREDVRVRYWAGEQIFIGMQPPPRLFHLAELRRVKSESWRQPVASELVVRRDLRPLFERLLQASPLSSLQPSARQLAPLLLPPILPWLSDRRVARVVIDRLTALRSRERAQLIGGAVADLLRNEQADPSLALTGVRLLCHLHLIDALFREHLATRMGAAEDLTYDAIFVAAHAAGLALPADWPGDFSSAYARHLAACRTRADSAEVRAFAAILQRRHVGTLALSSSAP